MRTLFLTCLMVAVTSAHAQKVHRPGPPAPPPLPSVSSVCLAENVRVAGEMMTILLTSAETYYADARSSLGLSLNAPYRLLSNENDDGNANG